MLSMQTLPFRKVGTPHWKEIRELKLYDDCILEQWIVPKGVIVKLHTTQNFGWCILPADTKDKRGFVIPRRIFKY